MKKFLIILFFLILAFIGFCYIGFKKNAHPKGFKTPIEPVQEVAPITQKTKGPKSITVGGASSVTVSVLGDDVDNWGILHDILVTNKINGKSIKIPQVDPYHMSIQTAGNQEDYLIVDTGTGTIRGLDIYNIDDASKHVSLCSLGYFIKGSTLVYADCTQDSHFDIRAAVVENGQYNPVIYKLAFDTLEKKTLLTSDSTHLYTPTDCANARLQGCEFHVTSVKKFSDWGDMKKWIEGVKILQI